MGEGDFRGDIRRVIFTKVRDNSLNVMNDSKKINKILIDYSKRYKDFDQLERLNIELTVPIQLPPNGKNGDCKAVVMEVQKSFNELGGGSRIFHALGSWLDDESKVVSDHCVVVYAAMPVNKWYECIPVLQRLIRDEIQSKLYQECVFLRIDNQTFGDPLNLLGDNIEDFPSIDDFGGIDPACEMILGDYQVHPVQSVLNQEIKGDNNIQIISEGEAVLVTGEGAIGNTGTIHGGVTTYKFGDIHFHQNDHRIEQLTKSLDTLIQNISPSTKNEVGLKHLDKAILEYKNGELRGARIFLELAIESLREQGEILPQIESQLFLCKLDVLVARCERDYEAINAQLEEIIDLSNKNGHLFVMTSAVVQKGKIREIQGDFSGALDNFFKAKMNLPSENSQPALASILGNIGRIYGRMGKNEKSEQYTLDSLFINMEMGDEIPIAITMVQLSKIYQKSNSMGSALWYAQKAHTYVKGLSSKNVLATVEGRLASIYRRIGDPEKGLEHAKNSHRLNIEIGNSRAEAFSILEMVRLMQGPDEFGTKTQLLSRAHDIFVDLSDVSGIYSACSLTAKLQRNEGLLFDAITTLSKAIENQEIDATDGTHTLPNLHFELGKVLMKAMLYEEAETNLILALENSKNAKKIHEIQLVAGSLKQLKRKINNLRAAEEIVNQSRVGQLDRDLTNEELQILNNLQAYYSHQAKHKLKLGLIEDAKQSLEDASFISETFETDSDDWINENIEQIKAGNLHLLE